jgi:hypothetical protein
MTKKRLREPITKITRLPKQIRAKVDKMIIGPAEDRQYYSQISEWLASKGFSIGKSIIGRYALELIEKKGTDSRKVRSIKDHIEKKVNTVELPENERKFYSLLNELIELYESELKHKSVLKEDNTIK